jgi:Mg-chelatase subunit ChlD
MWSISDPACRFSLAAAGPLDVALVLDSSASMLRSGRWAAAQASAAAILSALTELDSFTVVTVRGAKSSFVGVC